MFAINLDRELPHPLVTNYFVLNQGVKYDARYSICDVKINNIQVEYKVCIPKTKLCTLITTHLRASYMYNNGT